MVSLPPDLAELGASLAIGLLVGTERGWRLHGERAGSRAAGIRTFGLIGLLGGLTTRLARDLGAVVPAIAFGALAGFLLVAYAARVRQTGTRDATTEVAALLTFVLGAGPPSGFGAAAAALGVAAVALLAWRGRIHRAVAGLERKEVEAGVKLLALVFLVMPVLPAEPVGPWDALRLREVLWMVLLVSGLSFVGYVAMKRAGARAGLAVAALLGGLVSSTAVTLDFSRRARKHPAMTPRLAAGIVSAGGTMFARVIALVAVTNPGLLRFVAAPLGVAALLSWALAWRTWRREDRGGRAGEVGVGNPLALGLALKFALLLAVVTVLAAGLRRWLGDAGVYPLSVVAGLGDVDAITITLARQSAADLADTLAVHGILIACATDTALKAGLAYGIGGRAIGRATTLAYAIVAAAAVAALLGATALLA